MFNVCEILSVIVKKNWYFLVLTIFIELNLCDCSFIELIYLKRVVINNRIVIKNYVNATYMPTIKLTQLDRLFYIL